MKTKNIMSIVLLLVVFGSLAFSIPWSQGYTSLIDGYDVVNQSQQRTIFYQHPSNNVAISAAGQTFEGEGTYVSYVQLYLKKFGAPTGIMRAGIYNTTGTYGTNSVPDSILEYSANQTIESLTDTYALVTFTFSATLNLTLGTKYAVTIEAAVGGIDGGNYIIVGWDNTTPSHPGNGIWYASSAWTPSAAYDTVFYIYGLMPDVTPTPQPTTLSFTLDMRGVGAVANPSSTTSASGKEWFPKQGLGYAFYGHVWNYTNPYCNGAWTAYATLQRPKSLGNQTADSWADLAADDVTEVTSGALSNGYFNLGVSCQSQVNSVEIYQGWRINGTVTGSDATFTMDFLTRWTEQGVVIIEPTGSTGLPTPTPSGYIPVSYGYIVWYIVALIVVLLPAGVLGVLFRFGAWGFIIGLAIGAGLGFMLMPTIVPLWLVFVVVIGIVGMLLKNTVLGGSGGEKTI